MARHHSADQWRVWFLEFDQSDLTVAVFCESIGVSVQSYYKWRRRLNLIRPSNEVTAAPRNFVSVVLAESKLEIELPCGAIARVANDAGSMRPIIEVLLELGAKQ